MQMLRTSGRQVAPATNPIPLLLITDAHQACRDTIAARLGELKTAGRVRSLPPDAATIVTWLRVDPVAVLVVSCCDASLCAVELLTEVREQIPDAAVVVLANQRGLSFEQCAERIKPNAVVQSITQIVAVVTKLSLPAGGRPEWLRALRPLTPREAEIVGHVAAGLRNAQIAKTIGIAEKTVKVNLTNIYGKLNIRGRNELTMLAPQLLSAAAPHRALSV